MIEQLFNDAAPAYDRSGPAIFERFGVRLAEHMPISPGMRVLDVATGKGAVLRPISARVGAAGRVTGVDISEAILNEAGSALRDAGIENCDLCRMDAEHLEVPDAVYDAVTCAFSVFLFPDIQAALREMHRACRPGGCLGLTVFDKTPPPFDPGWPVLLRQFMEYKNGVIMPQQVAYSAAEVEALLAKTGFSRIEVRSELNELLYPTLDDWWNFQFTVGTRLTIQGMDEGTRTRFKEEYFEKMRPHLKADGLHLSLAVVYAIACR